MTKEDKLQLIILTIVLKIRSIATESIVLIISVSQFLNNSTYTFVWKNLYIYIYSIHDSFRVGCSHNQRGLFFSSEYVEKILFLKTGCLSNLKIAPKHPQVV